MQAGTESTGKQTPVSQGLHRTRQQRDGGSPTRHGRKSKQENDLKREV